MSDVKTSSDLSVLAGKRVLCTGGAGYIGSHVVIELLEQQCEVFVIDNLINSSVESLKRIETITGGKKVDFENVDICDVKAMEAYFAKHSGDSAFDACVHFAGLKAVGESVQKPLLYYNNNVTGTIVLLEQLKKSGCNNIVFSSSATVYGDPDVLPITEASPVGKITNPYGQTKYFIEIMLKDVAHTDKDMRVAVLRYFNPFGAHASGLIGEDPNGIPNNLTPYIAQVAVGKRPHLTVFGNDYDTVDGTGVRDYIHVVDLAKGHVAALAHSIYKPNATTNYDVFNLGTGKGVSVLEMLAAMSVACGKQLKHVMGPRRAGDVPTVYADCTKAETELHWKATKTLEEAMADTWRWQSQNPNGFSSL